MSDLTSNLEKLSGYLERFKSTGVSHHINGKNLWSKNGDTFQSVSPVDESFICDVAKGGAEEIALAAFQYAVKVVNEEVRKRTFVIENSIDKFDICFLL